MKLHRLISYVAVCILGLSLSSNVYAGKFLTMHAGSPGGATHTISTTFSSLAHKYAKGDITIQIASGKAATRSTVDAAKGKVDLFTTAASINEWFRTGKRMFKSFKNSERLHARLRAILMYPVGAYQFVVYADSGI